MYVPLDDYCTMKKKGDKYLTMSFASIDKISLNKWVEFYLFFHLKASIVYFLRFLFNMFKIGNKMPFRYELYIFYYNWRMIYLSFKKIKF